jgi:replicative DNA helicase
MATTTRTPKVSANPTAQISQMLGKVPPHNRDFEEAVLGAIMLVKDAIIDVVEILHPETFYDPKNSKIYEAIKALFAKNEPIDLLSVSQQLRSQGELELAGGSAYLVALTNKMNSAANLVYHSRILVELSIKRELIKSSGEIQRDAFEDTTDVFKLLDKFEQNLFEISEKNIRKNYTRINTLLAQTMKELEVARSHESNITGVPSGFLNLDRITSGWQKSDLVILAARPGMGKTAFVVSTMRNAALDFNLGVAIFSLEMASVQLVKRLISAEADVESEALRKAQLSDQDWNRVTLKIKKLESAPIFIDDTPALSVLELRAKARRLKAQHNIQLIIIDYLQLMSSDTGKSTGNREQEIAFISRSLKQLAKELDVPVIALSQLSRAVETRGGVKRPQLSDLRESGSIEQDADIVLFLYRPEYYGLTEDEEGMPTKGLAELIIAKHRNGALDNVKLKYVSQFTRFEDWGRDNFSNIDELNTRLGNLDEGSIMDDTEPAIKTVTYVSKLNSGRNGLDAKTPEVPF